CCWPPLPSRVAIVGLPNLFSCRLSSTGGRSAYLDPTGVLAESVRRRGRISARNGYPMIVGGSPSRRHHRTRLVVAPCRAGPPVAEAGKRVPPRPGCPGGRARTSANGGA